MDNTVWVHVKMSILFIMNIQHDAYKSSERHAQMIPNNTPTSDKS